MICLSQPSDSVITPCGHGGICFECCQQIISDVLKQENNELNPSQQPPFYFVGENQVKIYNFRCHLCRNIGLRVFQLFPQQESHGKQMLQKNEIIRARQYIDLQSAVPFVPIPIGNKKTNHDLDETFGYGDDDEEMKESLPLEYAEDELVAAH